jgi:hypothetical protein
MAVTFPYSASSANPRRSSPMRRAAVTAGLLLAALCPAVVLAFDAGRAPFAVLVDDLEIPYRVFAVFAFPGQAIDIEIAAPDPDRHYVLDAPDGELVSADVEHWRWRAPDHMGVTELTIGGNGDIRLNVVTMHAARLAASGRIDSYRIGHYPTEPRNGNRLYDPPAGFVELNDATEALQLSPHFRLSQFPSKQSTSLPKYLVLREPLLLKLELLLERLNASGIEADTFTIMSGYRTPYYNAAIGNVPYSRHVYGGAADIYVDVAPKDDYMDDLNGDGRSDFRDAQWLYGLAQSLFGEQAHRALGGGLGVYAKTSAHGPFLHIDARAARARWGLLP